MSVIVEETIQTVVVEGETTIEIVEETVTVDAGTLVDIGTAALAAHEADTTNVHGIVDTANILIADSLIDVLGIRLADNGADAPLMRLLEWQQTSPDLDLDRILDLTFNARRVGTNWTRDDAAREAFMFQMEAWWNANFEWNIDLISRAGVTTRVLGFSAAYDGTQASLAVGSTSSGHVYLRGGTQTASPLLMIRPAAAASATDEIFALARTSGGYHQVIRASQYPRWLWDLSGSGNAHAFGNWGLFKFSPSGGSAAGTQWTVEPIISFESVGVNAILLACYAADGDTKPRLQLRGDRIEFGPGNVNPDTTLSRSADGRLAVDGNNILLVGDDVATQTALNAETSARAAADTAHANKTDEAHGGIFVIKRRLNSYYTVPTFSTNATPTLNRCYWIPVWLPPGSYNQYAVYSSTPATVGSGSIARVGIAPDDGSATPDATTEFGTIALDLASAGVRTIAITHVINADEAGLWWLLLATQVSIAGGLAFSFSSGGVPGLPTNSVVSATFFWYQESVSGALPSNASSAINNITSVPRSGLRLSA